MSLPKLDKHICQLLIISFHVISKCTVTHHHSFLGKLKKNSTSNTSPLVRLMFNLYVCVVNIGYIEEAYRSEVCRFCEWCKKNHLTLNVDKTKELVFDYRRKKEPLTPLLINGKIVSIVDSYKYLGLKIDS